MSLVYIDKGRESYFPCDVVELVKAESCMVKLDQSVLFKDLNCLQNVQNVMSNSSLSHLNPVIDRYRIICVDGRLLESSIDNDKQFVVKCEMTCYVLKLIIVFDSDSIYCRKRWCLTSFDIMNLSVVNHHVVLMIVDLYHC